MSDTMSTQICGGLVCICGKHKSRANVSGIF